MRDLTPREQAAMDALRRAFVGVEHSLWTGERINAADTRFGDIRKLRAKGAANWTAQDIDWLFFKSSTTVGNEATTKFAFVRLVDALLRDELSGSTSAMFIADKLDYAGFTSWPERQRLASLDALEALATLWTTDEYREEDVESLRSFVARHR